MNEMKCNYDLFELIVYSFEYREFRLNGNGTLTVSLSSIMFSSSFTEIGSLNDI